MFGTDYKQACKWTESSEGYDYNNITRLNGNNNITRLNAYSKYYVPRRPRVGELEGVLDQVMVVLEDHIQVVVVLHVLDVVREYTFICVEIKSVSASETFIS